MTQQIKDDETPMDGHCLKCREKRTMNDTEQITMKNGRPATRGICSVCGAKMFMIGKAT